MRLGKVDDAELVTQRDCNVHLGKGTGCHGYAIFSSDLPGRHKTGFSATKQNDGVVPAALTGFKRKR